SLSYLGLELIHTPSKSYAEARLGFKAMKSGENHVVKAMYPGGPAEIAGIVIGDEIIAVNGYASDGQLDKWLSYFDNDGKNLTINRGGKIFTLTLPEVDRNFYMEYSIHKVDKPIRDQKNGFEAWKK
ncbi:MAG: PDZ domain-containing protein, partial [Crocinitomicaceae bacterium]|nr:PDZ domain-containing protein [Crocinitomicaceae bacterium]